MKILILGLGSIGQRHLRNLRRKFGKEIEILGYPKTKRQVVLTDTLAVKKGTTLEERYNIKIFEDVDKAFAEKPDVVFIYAPTNSHIPYALKGAKTGCHLFIEKPLSHSMEGVEELKKICKKNNLVVALGFQFRFNPVVKLLKEKVETNAIGNILSVHIDMGEYLPNWHKYEDYRKTYAARKNLGGGIILSQIHELDYLSWIFGMPEKIYALGGKLSDLKINVEDTVDALFQMNFQGKKFPLSLHLDYIQYPMVRTSKVIGTKGNVVMDLVKTSFVIYRTDSREERKEYPNFERNQMFIDELDHFFECIDKKTKPLASLEEGINSLKLALKIKKLIKN